MFQQRQGNSLPSKRSIPEKKRINLEQDQSSLPDLGSETICNQSLTTHRNGNARKPHVPDVKKDSKNRPGLVVSAVRLLATIGRASPRALFYRVASTAPLVVGAVALSWISGKLVNAAYGAAEVGALTLETKHCFIGLLAMGFGLGVCRIWDYYTRQLAQTQATRTLDRLVAKAAVGHDLMSLKRKDVQDKFAKVTHNLEPHVVGFSQRALDCAAAAFQVGIAALAISQLGWWAGPVLLLAAVPRFLAAEKFNKELLQTESDRTEDLRKYYTRRGYLSTTGPLLGLKLFQRGGQMLDAMTESYDKGMKKLTDAIKKNGWRQTLAESGTWLAQGLVGYQLLTQVINGTINQGEFVFLLGVMGGFAMSVSNLFGIVSTLRHDLAFVQDAFDLVDSATHEDEKTDYVPSGVNWNKGPPEITLRNVTLYYPNSSAPAVDNISVTIRPGDFVGIVGASGSGKSTLATILAKLYQPSSGEVLVDGVPLSDISKAEWLQHVSMMLQGYMTYDSLTVRDDIQLGQRLDGTGLSPEEAAAKAGADFISKLPNGLNTVEGPEYTNGFGFSGGQRQQIAASRVLCRKPKILFADEPTASLDAEHESVLTAGLTSNDRDCTVIYISHRFRTLLNADKILVLNEGRLEAVGTHDQLMQDPEGTYARNYRLQSE